MLLNQAPDTWQKQVDDYESRMIEYFSQCSAKLRDWYEQKGGDSEEYRAEYKRLSDEYGRYVKYIKSLRDYVNNTSVSDQADDQPDGLPGRSLSCSRLLFS